MIKDVIIHERAAMTATIPFPTDIRNDPAWRAVLHLFHGAFSDEDRVWDYVNRDDWSIDFESMLRNGAWSGGERILLEVAASLFDSSYRVSLFEAGHRLAPEHWPLVMEALTLFRKVAKR